ncbi:MAG: hypothetical protein SOZ06_01080 [Candidatus Faecenecus gallistercoris]|nr:hypothetical protein [Bacillota bacterium]MDD7102303.1 hypothetical protein [Bacillota bacterium]MDY4050557.1 hypothetical protein [Candidatus Faecenecus gallistercoris]
MKNATRLNDEQCTKILAKYLEMYIAVENLTVTHRVVSRTSGFDIVHELRYVQPQRNDVETSCLTMLNEKNYSDLLGEALRQKNYDLRRLDYRYDSDLTVTQSAQVFPKRENRKKKRDSRSTLIKVKK